jgi:N12 class adenine-specific DNA methylase
VPDADHQNKAIARELGLCSALDEVLEESSRVNRKIIAEARDATRAVLNRQRSRDRYRRKQ